MQNFASLSRRVFEPLQKNQRGATLSPHRLEGDQCHYTSAIIHYSSARNLVTLSSPARGTVKKIVLLDGDGAACVRREAVLSPSVADIRIDSADRW